MVRLEKINEKNFRQCIKTEVNEEQKKFVASNVVSLAQAYISTVEKDCIPMPYAIYNDDEMVGFVMLAYSEEEDQGSYDVWRMMIGKDYQGKGYGRAAMQKAIELIRTFPHGEAKQVTLSFVPTNETAKKLYNSLGFFENGEMDGDEVVAVLEL